MTDPAPPSPPRRLRVGVMVPGDTLQAWQLRALERLLAVDGVDLGLVIVDGGEDGAPPTAGRRLGELFFKLHQRLIARPAAFARRDAAALLAGAPRRVCKVRRQGRFKQVFAADDLEAIRAADLDLILRFAFGIISGDVLTAARHGVWSFHHDDEDRFRGRPAAFWSVYHGDAVSGAILQRLTDRLDGGVILRKGWLPTCRHSYARNADRVFLASAEWPADVCRALLAGCADWVDAPPSTTTAPIFKTPTNAQMLAFWARQAGRGLAYLAGRLLRQQDWHVGVTRRAPADLLDGAGPGAIDWLPKPPSGKFIADPFPVEHDGRRVVLVEDYDYRTETGRISWTECVDGAWTPPRPAIEQPFHLAYPQVLDIDGVLHCLPEAADAGRTTLYRCTRFPDAWEPVAELLPGVPLVDPTLFRHDDGRWWLMGTDRRRGSCEALCLWWADHPAGPWHAHPLNPVKIDVRTARPGGAPFRGTDGALYRPAQDCSTTYGRRLVLLRVDALTPTAFAETPVTTVEPQAPYGDGLHTLAGWGSLTVVDGKRHRFVPAAAGGLIRRVLRVPRGPA